MSGEATNGHGLTDSFQSSASYAAFSGENPPPPSADASKTSTLGGETSELYELPPDAFTQGQTLAHQQPPRTGAGAAGHKLIYERSQHPSQSGGGGGGGGEARDSTAGRPQVPMAIHMNPLELFQFDTRYLQSLEGIFRTLQLPFALVGMVIAWVYMILGTELWYVAVGMAYIIYILVVLFVETILAQVYVHRLVDGLITTAFAAAWLSAAIATTFSAQGERELGASAAFAYLLTFLAAFSALLSFHTWRTYEAGKVGSRPMF